MFRYPKLIPALILVGCGVTPDTSNVCEAPTQDSVIVTNIVTKSNHVLESIDATLEIADVELQHIEEIKQKKNNYIISLENHIQEEQTQLNELIKKLNERDSIIDLQVKYQKELQLQIYHIENDLIEVEHKCETHCFPTIIGLKNTNLELVNKLDSLGNEIAYRDSLILSSRKLSKSFQ